MEKRDKIFEQIEAYLAGELSPEEKSSFETLMKADAEIAEEVSLQRDTHQLLGLYSQQVVFKDKLRVIDAKIESETNATKTIPLLVRILRSPVYRVAAVGLILIVAAYVLLIFQYDSSRIGNEQFSPYQDVITVKGDAMSADSLLVKAMIQYNRKDYQGAQTSLVEMLEYYPDYPDARFYLAMSLMAEGKDTESLPHLQKLEGSGKYGEVSQWYLALAYLRSGNRTNAAGVLDQIMTQSNHGYYQKATRLRSKLDAPWWGLPGIN